jgi:hypothetical protein
MPRETVRILQNLSRLAWWAALLVLLLILRRSLPCLLGLGTLVTRLLLLSLQDGRMLRTLIRHWLRGELRANLLLPRRSLMLLLLVLQVLVLLVLMLLWLVLLLLRSL